MKEVKSFSAKDVTPRINAGFSQEKPANVGEIIDASFECVRIIEKNDKNGVKQIYPILAIHGKENVVSKVFNAADLLGKETHPCIQKGDRYVIDDESFVCTWDDELTFNKRP